MRKNTISLLAMALIPLTGHGQTANAATRFEAASIKPSPGCERVRRDPPSPPSPGRLTIECTTLEKLIEGAYGLYSDGLSAKPQQLTQSGGPEWIQSERYDIAAKAEDGASFARMAGPMMRVLLEDRFQLKVHRETQEMPAYVLTVAKGGAKLKESACTAPEDVKTEGGQPQPFSSVCRNVRMKRGLESTAVDAIGLTAGEFSHFLSAQFGQAVIDQTGLAGKFDYHLQVSLDETGDDAFRSALAAALPQIGLRITREKAPVDVLVIDHAEKPTGN